MKNQIFLPFTLLSILTVTACTEAEGEVAPPGCTQIYSNGTLSCTSPNPTSYQCCDAADGTGYLCWPAGVSVFSSCEGSPFDPAGGSGSSGAAPVTGTTTGEDGCTVDCPEPSDGVCGGHAEWSSGILIWPIHRPNDASGAPNMMAPASITHQDPACTSGLDVCLPYMEPFDEGDEANADALQLQACNALTLEDLNALGLGDTTIGKNGWSLVDHVCTQGPGLSNFEYGTQTFSVSAIPSQSACLGDWSYEQYCSAADCPLVEEGAVDGSSGGSEFDCSALEGDDVAVNLRSEPRTITVQGEASGLMWDGPFTALYYCGGAQINSAGKIHQLDRRALLKSWGLMEDDVIVTVDGSDSDMVAAGLAAADQGRTFTLKVKRGVQVIDYVIDVH